MAAGLLPATLPGILPAVPEDEFQLPSLKDIDPKRKRKANKQRLPTLGLSRERANGGGRRRSGGGPGAPSAVRGERGFSRLVRLEGSSASASEKKGVSQQAFNKGSLEELLEVVKIIEEECLLDPEKEAEGEKGLDPFFKAKNAIMHVVEETRELIEQRRRILETRGTTYEAISKRSAISDNISYLRKKFQELGDLYAQQYRQRKALKLSDEELDDRHQQLNALLKEIELVHKLSKNGGPPGAAGLGLSGDVGAGRSAAVSLTALAATPLQPGEEEEGERNPQAEELTEEDQIVLQRWKERDKEFDAQVKQIGDAIDRIADVAVTIGQQADMQSEKVEELAHQTNQAAAELQLLDSRLKKFMKEQSASNLCCKLILLLLVMLLICFVFSTVYARYIKKA
ncbi:hypothetical protein Efla_002643 [Eimeria flavescens]